MAQTRLYSSVALGGLTRVLLDETAARHAHVLRLSEGDPLRVFDGLGAEYEARVVGVARHRLELELGACIAGDPESPLKVTLVQAVSKGERMDWSIQKSVELGVSAVQPVFSARSVVRLDGPRLSRRVEHWQGVIRSACEQSGRRILPTLHPPLSLVDYLYGVAAATGTARRLMLAPEAPQQLRALDAPPAGTPTLLLIGPEGGFSPDEVDAAKRAGFIPIGLGPRVLRTETAGVVALAVLQALWGDLC
jgi:16S rRNA (uracil1498-N3)-methyltransferase